LSSSPLFSDEQSIYSSTEGLSVSIQEVTESKESVGEAQQQGLNAQIQVQLIELAHDAIIVRDSGSRIVSWNKGAERLYGWTAQEAIGQISHELLQARFPVPREEIDDFLATGERWEGELVHINKNGSEVIVDSRQIVTHNHQSLPIAILEVNRNITRRKQRERENQEQYRTIVRTANEGIWLIDTQAHTLFMNDRMANLLGYKVEEIMGRTVPEFTFPEDGPKAQERIGSNLQGNLEQFDFRFRRKDGSTLHVFANTSPVRDGLGEIIGALGMFTDMTERKKAEEDQLRLAAIVEDSDDAIVSKTLDGIINSWNRAAEKMFGYTVQEAVGKHITIIIPEELREEENAILRRLRNGEHIDHFETERMRKDGARIEVSLSISPMRNKEGRIIGASKIARDITERKQLQRRFEQLYREVRQSRDQLDIILQGVADGIIVYDAHSHIIYANEEAARMTGAISVQAMMEGPLGTLASKYEIIDEQRQPFPRTQFTHLRVLAGEQEPQDIIGYRNIATGQSERWSLVKSRPIVGERGEVMMVVTIIHDITERIQAEQRKDEFISMTSHELKTPVTSLKGFTHVLQRRLTKQGDEQGLHYLSRMNAQLDKLVKLISDLLDISRMQTGHLTFQNEAFDLDKLIYETVENVQVATTTHQFLVEGHTNASIVGDRDRLGQVFINLLTNAEKYSPKAKKVIARLSQEQEMAVVRVQDFGIGVDPRYHQKIFERFYQVTDPEERTYPGLGIGLYISKQIIEYHHGQISVQSRKGEGSTFSVALPIYKKESEQGVFHSQQEED
jgi:PAS domain S-box-containing protein